MPLDPPPTCPYCEEELAFVEPDLMGDVYACDNETCPKAQAQDAAEDAGGSDA